MINSTSVSHRRCDSIIIITQNLHLGEKEKGAERETERKEVLVIAKVKTLLIFLFLFLLFLRQFEHSFSESSA